MRKNNSTAVPKLLYLAAVLSTAVLIISVIILFIKYIIPVYSGELTFIHDFSFYKSAAERFLENPHTLYASSSREFIYPPPAVALFIIFSGMELPAAYTLFLLVSLACLLAAIFFAIRTAEKLTGRGIANRTKFIIYLIAAGNAPVYMNFQASQVGTILIFFISIFFFFLAEKKYLAASFGLVAGVLLKLYPLILLLAGIRKRKLIIGFVSIMIAAILLSLFIIPSDVYSHYVFSVIPQISSNVELNTYNQSLTAVILRLTDMYEGGWGEVRIPLTLSLINNFLFLLFLAYTGYKIITNESMKIKILYSIALSAVIPVFTTLGWGHLYILTIPLLIYFLFQYPGNAIVFIVFLIFAIDIPDSVFNAIQSEILSWLFHSRFLVGTLLLISLFLLKQNNSPVLQSSH